MKRLLIFLGFALVLTGCATGMSKADRPFEGKTLYLQSNIWFEHPMKINAINYHKGAILKAGTRVRVEKRSSRVLKFVTLKNGLEYRILFSKKYFPGTRIEEFASWYFGPENPLKGSEYAGFSSVEKKGVEEGTIKKGMSRKAVLISYGHPPRHRTRSLDLNTWSYWNNRLFRMEVRFGNDGRVKEIIGGGH